MLTNMPKAAFVLAAALSFTSNAALAANHTVEIVEGAFVPTISYIEEGDRVTFVNGSQSDHVITGLNGAWTTGTLTPGGRHMMTVDSETILLFTGQGWNGLMEGSFTFEDAPL